MNEHLILNKQLDVLKKLVDFMTPNSKTFDVDYLEDQIQEGFIMYKEVSNINIFMSLEKILFEKDERMTDQLIERINNSLDLMMEKWGGSYSSEKLKRSENESILFKSAGLKTLVFRTDSKLKEIQAEIRNFQLHWLQSLPKSDLMSPPKHEQNSSLQQSLMNLQGSNLNLEKPKGISKPSTIKLFHDYLLYRDKLKLAIALQNEYYGEKGKAIRLMFEGLKKNNCIIIQKGTFKSVFLSLKNYFEWDIGSYPSVNDYKFDKSDSEEELKHAETRIKLIIQNLENPNK